MLRVYRRGGCLPQMSLHLHNCDHSTSTLQWPGENWESTHSCLSTVAQESIFPEDTCLKHKLHRSQSDPGLACSTVTLELNTSYGPSELKNDHSVEESVVLSEPSTLDSLKESPFSQTDEEFPSPRTDNLETVWTSDRGHSTMESTYYDDEVVNLEDYYYDDEETKSHIFPFQKCSLRFHGLLFLILIYAAGYIAYVIVSPPRKRCQRPPPSMPPEIMP